MSTLHENKIGLTASSRSAVGEVSDSVHTRISQNIRLIWLGVDTDEVNGNDGSDRSTRTQFFFNDIDKFTNAEHCIQFVNQLQNETVLLVVTGYVGQHIMPIIHPMAQLDSVFLLCGNKSKHERWTKQWSKIRSIFTDMSSLYNALHKAAQQLEQNCVSMSFMPASVESSQQNMDQHDQSFMYTQILKESLLHIDFDQSHIQEFVEYSISQYCQDKMGHDDAKRRVIDDLALRYYEKTAIWWYTYESFLYKMLNESLRFMDIDIITKMGFFVSDLHRQITSLHHKQFIDTDPIRRITVYRGQGLSETDFGRMLTAKGGLMSFNNFLSTSEEKLVSVNFAKTNLDKPNLIAVLFEIEIDLTLQSTPFARIKEHSALPDEEEILFSMHSVFRIHDIEKLESDIRVWKVSLAMASDSDQKLSALSQSFLKETRDWTGWNQLAMLLIRLAKYDKAQQLLEFRLQQTSDPFDKAFIHNLLGISKHHQGQYSEALSFHETALAIEKEALSNNHPHLAATYNYISLVYSDMADHLKAIQFHELALATEKGTLLDDDLLSTILHKKTGSDCFSIRDQFKALSLHELALAAENNILLYNHSDSASLHTGLGSGYPIMGGYSKALSFHRSEKAIDKQTFLDDYDDSASLHTGLGSGYPIMGGYSKALSFHGSGKAIDKQTFLDDYDDSASLHTGLGSGYPIMGGYSKALSFHGSGKAIDKQTLLNNYDDSATHCNNAGGLYSDMGEYTKALSFYERALKIRKQTFPDNLPYLATCYNNIGGVYSNKGEYSKALSFYKKALKIREETLPDNHPDLTICYSNIGSVCSSIGDYSNALSFYERALKIREETLPGNHPHLAAIFENIGKVYEAMGDCSTASWYIKRATDIRQSPGVELRCV